MRPSSTRAAGAGGSSSTMLSELFSFLVGNRGMGEGMGGDVVD